MNYTGEYEFEFDDHLGGYSAQLICACEELIFPCEYDGFKVLSIWADDSGAGNRQSVKRVVVPKGILNLEGPLFECFTSLETVEISSSVKYISSDAFMCCSSLKEFKVSPHNEHYTSIDGNLYSKDGSVLVCLALGQIGECFNVPEFVKVIAPSAFAHSKISDVILPEGVVEIGENAFNACSALRRVIIPNSVQKIDDFAFAYCSSLEVVFIPKTVEQIGYCLFLESNFELKILCEAESKKPYWDSGWAEGFKVSWGYKK